MLTSLLFFIGVGATLYLILCVFLYVQQDRMIFYPGPNDAGLVREWQANAVQIPSGEHLLEGWWADNPESTSTATAIYFGGNAEDVLFTAATARRFDVSRILFVNYRGYGGSPGKPSQATLYADALAIYDYVVEASPTLPANIVVIGRSLGSGLATLLAAKRTVRAAVLITPYDSIASVAANHYPMFPVRLLLKHPFDATLFAQQTDTPALIIAAAHDRVIPPAHAQRLFEAWSGPKTIHVLEGVGHNDVERHEDYYGKVNAFLREW